MRLLGRRELLDFSRRHADCRGAIESWTAEVEKAKWQSTQNIKDRYRTASFISGTKVVFNIGGNKYRLYAKLDFTNSIVLVIKVGTHQEYLKWSYD
jgi:mRNA interferase HigB